MLSELRRESNNKSKFGQIIWISGSVVHDSMYNVYLAIENLVSLLKQGKLYSKVALPYYA